MKTGVIRLVAVLLVILMGLGGYWFYQNFALLPEKTYVGFQGEARYNSLLAAQSFLHTKANLVKGMTGLVGLPPINGTLVMPTQRYGQGPKQAKALLDWVRAGGNLIVVPTEPSEGSATEDWLLRGLGVRNVNHPPAGSESYAPANVDIPAVSDFMQVDFMPCATLEYRGHTPQVLVRGDRGAHVLRYQLGAGVLTVLSDANFMHNAEIGRYDNAAFLWYLTHYQRRGETWLIYSGDMPPLWKWLGTNAWTVLISAGLLLAACLWSCSRRFGPIRVAPPLARRRLLDHIEASGQFLWQKGQRVKLLSGVREALLRRLESRHPALAALPPDKRATRLAELIQAPPTTTQKALFDPFAPDEYEFTDAVNLLEKIRKTL